MALGLSHSLSRYKLKFSPDKVDTMIVQAIGKQVYIPQSLFTLHSSLLTPHSSLLTPHSSLLTPHTALLDDLDKELNNYNMRCREWYGWHFPELGKIIPDNLIYAKTVRTIGQSIACETSMQLTIV